MARRSFLSNVKFGVAAAAVSLSIASASLAPLSAFGQVVPPPVENSRNSAECIINTDNVYVRSGAGDNYYPTMKVAKGTKVIVVGEKFDWLKIAPPAGSFSYVGKHFIEKTADGVGKVNRENVNVRAGSDLNALKTTVQAQLSPGQEVKILDEVEEYYKITPPADAAVYVKKDFVDVVRVVPQIASNATGTGTTPEPTKTPGELASASGSYTTSGPDATSSTPVPDDKQPLAKASSPPSTQPSAEIKFDKLEAEFETVSAKPIEQQPVTEMLQGYKQLISDPQLPESMRRVADYRTQILKARAEARDQFVQMQKQQDETKKKIQAYKSEQEEIAQQIQKTEVKIYTAVGTLRTSSIQQGGQGNGLLYRLTDPQNGRTVCYLRSAPPGDDAPFQGMMGQFIGVKGEVSTDPALGLKVVSATDVAPVDPNQLFRGVGSQIVPPSLLPQAGDQIARQASGTE